MNKLIVLRGPSGSGKSSIAKAVRAAQSEPMAYIEQDYWRRTVLKEKDVIDGLNIQLIKQVVLFSLENSYDVIMEGIFDKNRYQKMFEELISLHPQENYFFYFDISFEETLRRHETKPNKDEFGEKEMKAWYKEKDFLECVSEEVISERTTMEGSIKQIQAVSGLANRF